MAHEQGVARDVGQLLVELVSVAAAVVVKLVHHVVRGLAIDP